MDKPKRRIYSSVDEIFETDDLGIFQDIQKEKPVTSDSGLKQSKFDEINSFLDSNKRKPNFESNEVSERSLARRLQAYREDLELGLCVVDYDRYGLLDGFARPLEVDVTQLAQEGQVSDSGANQSREKEQHPEVVTLSELIQFELALTLFTQQIEDLESKGDKRSIEFAQSLNQFFRGWASFFDNEWQPYYDRFLDLFNEMQDIGLRIDVLTKKAFSEAFSGDADNVEQDCESEQEDSDYYEGEEDGLDEDSLSLIEPDIEPVEDNSQVASMVKNNSVDDASGFFDRQQPKKEQVKKHRGLFDEFRFDDSNEGGSVDEGEVSNNKTEPMSKTRQEVSEAETPKTLSLEDIFDDDDLGIFDDIDADLFDVPLELQDPRTRTFGEDDLIGERKSCANFDEYKSTFDLISKHLAEGNYNRHDVIRESSINIGSVFVINNMVAYVADKYLAEDRGDKSKRNERLKLVFANGTESNMLAFSLTLVPYRYDNTYQVEITDPAWIDAHFSKSFMGDSETKLKEPDGYIYIARLKDKPDELYHYKDLHKIGLTRKSGEGRTKDSINDATFLHRQVEIVGEWAIRNADIYKVEQYIHRFLKEAKVVMKVATNKDRLQGASEWFDVPYHEIDKVVQLVVSGDIADYKYDPYRKKVVFK